MKKTILILTAFAIMAFTEGEKHCYVRVTKTWYDTYKGYTKGTNVLNGEKDTSGNYYISLNSYNEFQELFENKSTVTLYWLYPNAFPKDTL